MRKWVALGVFLVGCGSAPDDPFAAATDGVGSAPSVSTGGTQATGGATSTGGAPIATGGRADDVPDASTGGASVTASGGAGGVHVASGGAATGGVVATGGTNSGGALPTGGTVSTGGAVARGGEAAAGGAVSTGGVAATGGASAADPLAPYPAPDCDGFIAYWVPQGGCLLVVGRYQARSPGLCDVQNPTVYTCAAVTTDAIDGRVTYLRAEPNKKYTADRFAAEGCAARCPQP